ncbi:hypothetical protein Plhal703r1_c01g0001401 [Plasmopara halstedii]
MSRYPYASRPLSDNLVSLVCPRAIGSRYHPHKMVSPYQVESSLYKAPQTHDIRDLLNQDFLINAKGPGTFLSLNNAARVYPSQFRPELKAFPASEVSALNSSPSKLTETDKRKREDAHKFRRREQCRANQARYRHKQKNAQLQLEKSTEELHKDLETLKRRYRDLSSRERIIQSPWSIVADVFRLLDICFRSSWRMTSTKEMKFHTETRELLTILERSFASNVAMGELQGVDAMMEQLLLYSQIFQTSWLQLQRIERVAPGVMAARATINLTLTEFTLRHAFPHLEESTSQETDGSSLFLRLLDQQLECRCSLTFFFDEESDRVVRLAASVDLMTPLLQVLGTLEDVKTVLEHARISEECVIRKAREKEEIPDSLV